MSKAYFNNEGFSPLMGLMITAGITSVLVLSLMQSTSTVQKTQGWVNDHREITALLNRAEIMLQNNSACGGSFQNQNPRGSGQTTRLNGIQGPSGNIQIAKNTQYGSITLDDIIMQNFVPDTPTATTGWAEILFKFSRDSRSPMGGREVHRTIAGVRVGLNAPANRNGMVQTCQSQSATTADLCTTLGGIYNPMAPIPCELTQTVVEEQLARSPHEENGYGNQVTPLRCPNNFGMVGIEGRSGAALDRIRILCKAIDWTQDPPVPSPDPAVPSLYLGGAGGGPYGPLLCPNDTWVIGVGGKANNAGTITRIELKCGKFDQSGATTSIFTPNDPRWGGTPWMSRCSPNKILRKLDVRFSNYMSGLRGTCI